MIILLVISELLLNFLKQIPNSGSFYNATYVNVWDKINGELILQSESSEDLYQGITGKMIMEYDLENHQCYLTRGLGEDGWSYVTIKQVIQSLVAKQNFKTVTQDNSNERFLNSCEMITHLDLGNSNWYNADPLYREQYLREYMLKGWKTYTLLPVGIELLSTEQEIEDSLNAFGQEYHRLYDYDWNFISAGNASPGNHMDIVQNAIDM